MPKIGQKSLEKKRFKASKVTLSASRIGVRPTELGL
jgi:hypothetical protein